MRVLLTNDDGIRAPGIEAMFDALVDGWGEFGGPLGGDGLEVVAVAPLTVQSATSHGVTFHEPLMTRRVRVNERMEGIGVEGRPADCVKLAISSLWPERFGEGSRPDLLVSGMNAGANAGINVIYSGTVAAAIEGAFLGVPSIAVSLHIGGREPRWDVAGRRARGALDVILSGGLPRAHECINVNVPVSDAEGPMPALKVCMMNTHGLVDRYERRVNPAGEVYYWASGHGMDFHATEPGTDVDELFRGSITVTPLGYDLTRREDLARWRERVERG